MTMMTKQDRHDLEAIEARALNGVCEHGRAIGFSNYDVAFCGACEADLANEAAEAAWLEDLDAAGCVFPFPIGPTRTTEDERVLLGFGDRRPASTEDDLPF